MTSAKETSIKDDYMLAKGAQESARLYIQHYMWKYLLGYLLHPLIPKEDGDLKVADLGTGNACWLIDLANECPPTWQFQGFDVTDSFFPAKEYLPQNVGLRVMDVFDDIPEEYAGKFDVVHIRALAVVIKHNNPAPFLKNVMKLLKPGGYIQWDELDCATFHAHAPNDSISTAASTELLSRWQHFSTAIGLDYTHISHLPALFSRPDITLDVLDHARYPLVDPLRRASTDNFTMALEEVGEVAAAKYADVLGPPAGYRALWAQAVRETEKGVSIGMDMVTILGRKAGS